VNRGSARKQPAADESRKTLLFSANRGPIYPGWIGDPIVESTYSSSQGKWGPPFLTISRASVHSPKPRHHASRVPSVPLSYEGRNDPRGILGPFADMVLVPVHRASLLILEASAARQSPNRKSEGSATSCVYTDGRGWVHLSWPGRLFEVGRRCLALFRSSRRISWAGARWP
jgi:hypothetical protein